MATDDLNKLTHMALRVADKHTVGEARVTVPSAQAGRVPIRDLTVLRSRMTCACGEVCENVNEHRVHVMREVITMVVVALGLATNALESETEHDERPHLGD